MERRTFLGAAGAFAALSLAAQRAGAQAGGAPEKASVKLGVGGKALLYYLPLTIAERKGYFKEEGLEVEINDFGGGAKSLQALIGGSVDVVTGAYEHTIRMQAKGQDIEAVCELGRFPAIVIAVRKSEAGSITSAADFKGKKIGVTAPGSSTAITAQYAMVKAGLKPTDAAFIGVGGGAGGIAAMQKGEIDIISHLDPVIAKLEELDLIKVPGRHANRGRHQGAVRRLQPGGRGLPQVGLRSVAPQHHAAARQRSCEGVEMAQLRDARKRRRPRAARVPFRRQAALPQGSQELS